MRSQLSRFGKGMVLLTLLMLGFSHKGTYGKVPVFFRGQYSAIKQMIASRLSDCQDHFRNHTCSLFIHSKSSAPLLLLVSYDNGLADLVEESLGSSYVPLLISVSTLPPEVAYFDSALLEFEQHDQKCRQTCANSQYNFIPLNDDMKFGGSLRGNEVRKAVVLLTEAFDVRFPITVRYGDMTQVLSLE